MEIDLQPPAEDHWNIASDKVLPSIMDEFQQKWEPKVPLLAHGQASYSGETAAGAQGGAPRPQDGGTTPSWEQVLKTTQVHALHLQSMHELGSIREVDRTLAQTLMAEFTRLQLIVNEDLIKSLLALHADLEVSSVALVLAFKDC